VFTLQFYFKNNGLQTITIINYHSRRES